MLQEFLSTNWQAILTIIGGVIAWIYKRPIAKWMLKQNKADVRSTEASTESTTVENLGKSLNIYIALIDDIEKRYEEKLKKRDLEIKRLEDYIIELEEKLNRHINE